MPLNTVALSAALTPTVISTCFSHYLHRKSHHRKPSVHISYDEAIHIMREFLAYVSKYPVEDLQAFTQQWVPSPHWVRTETAPIAESYLNSAATAIINQLGPRGVARVGGKEWWQWRGPAEELKGEWIEMRYHYNERKKKRKQNGGNAGDNRIILYVHGGAYFFGSVDTHRYQMQRHARKLKGQVFARYAEYRLSPQFPFPCSLQDCLAAYLFLLDTYKSSEIIFAGDSAGGGMVLSMLVIIRDQGLPMPAGGILISPWVDLTHSFPSMMSESPGDYIPNHGFRHKPSRAWPPPNSDEIRAIKKETLGKAAGSKMGGTEASQAQDMAIKGYEAHKNDSSSAGPVYPGEQKDPEFDDPALLQNVTIPLDGETFEIKDQINMYTTNQLLSHPLVSPILQPSLGGLPPLLIQSGGGELLRDEQFYLAHKAANPTAYQPSDVYLDEYDPNREMLNKYPPTYVQLQVWDDLCHVAPSLSFSRPAKYMYRAIAQFGAWALARAQNSEIDILDDNEVSPISSSDSDSPEAPADKGLPRSDTAISAVGRAGDPLPPFEGHMMRQRVDKRGNIYPLDPPSSYPVLQLPKAQVGAINPALVKRWLAAKNEWDVKFQKEKLRTQQDRIKELAHGFQDFNGESPPPSSLAARRAAPGALPARRARKGYPMMIWSGWGSKHDKRALERERLAEKEGRPRRTSVEAGPAGASITEGEKDHIRSATAQNAPKEAVQGDNQPGSGSRNHIVIDVAKANDDTDEAQSSANGLTNGETSKQRLSQHTKKSSNDQPLSPLLVLPDYDNKQSIEDNASTRALFHASGAIPTISQTSLPRSKYHASSRAGSITGRSGIMSDVTDNASTIGDERSLAVTNTTGLDTASTRAVIDARGVVGLLDDGESARASTDALSSMGDVTGKEAGHDRQNSGSRPGMPERDFFHTAEEYP